jgi:hypothetical protein
LEERRNDVESISLNSTPIPGTRLLYPTAVKRKQETLTVQIERRKGTQTTHNTYFQCSNTRVCLPGKFIKRDSRKLERYFGGGSIGSNLGTVQKRIGDITKKRRRKRKRGGENEKEGKSYINFSEDQYCWASALPAIGWSSRTTHKRIQEG